MSYYDIDCNGVTPVIGTLLVVMVVFSIVGSILIWGIPHFERNKIKSLLEGVYSQLEILEETLHELIYSDEKDVRESKLFIETGNLYFKTSTDRMIFLYSYNSGYDFEIQGLNTIGKNFTLTMLQGICTHLNITWTSENGVTFSQTKPVMGNPSTVEVDREIKGTVSIFLYNDTILFGRVEVFDFNSILYELHSAFGTYKFFLNNGAIIVHYPINSSYLNSKPIVYKNKKIFSFHLIQLNSSKFLSGGGSLKYHFSINVISHIIIENNKISFLKIRIYGENKYAWHNYFTRVLGFDDNLNYPITSNNISFVLAESFLNIRNSFIS